MATDYLLLAVLFALIWICEHLRRLVQLQERSIAVTDQGNKQMQRLSLGPDGNNPVFSAGQIAELFNEAREHQRLDANLRAAFLELMRDHKAGTPLSAPLTDLMAKQIDHQVDGQIAFTKVLRMLEANLAVLRGLKSITEAYEEVQKQHIGSEARMAGGGRLCRYGRGLLEGWVARLESVPDAPDDGPKSPWETHWW